MSAACAKAEGHEGTDMLGNREKPGFVAEDGLGGGR